MITIIRSDEVAEARDYLSEIFVDGFYVWLKYFSKDKDKLINALNTFERGDVSDWIKRN